MKTAFTILILSLASGIQAFAPAPAFSRAYTAKQLFADKPDNENEEGLDLDLGEMFDMFEAADKEENFDDAIKKVKKDK
jgi:hypothetical protein